MQTIDDGTAAAQALLESEIRRKKLEHVVAQQQEHIKVLEDTIAESAKKEEGVKKVDTPKKP